MIQQQFSIYDASAGAGKTFTLVKEYLKILLNAPNIDAYRTVLAITFTNKAVNEMKTRVIDTLQGFANTNIPEKYVIIRNLISQETGLSYSFIQEKSAKIFNHLLHNYAAFDILTIDKFTHRVIRSFATDVGLPPDFELTLDMDQLLQMAVERIIEKTGTQPEITSVLLDFILQKSEDDKSWDVFQDLLKFSKLLKTENHLSEIQLLKHWNLEALCELQLKLRTKEKQIQNMVVQLGEEALQRIQSEGLEPNHFFKSYIYNYFSKVKNGLIAPYELFDKYLIQPDSRYSKSTPTIAKNAVDSLVDILNDIHQQIKVLSNEYQWINLTLPNLVPLSFLHIIQNELSVVQEEQNVVALAAFNKIIHDELSSQPALFIYEKIGERYRHFFIDEFQDTSILQWENLIPLIANALAGESNTGVRGSVMIVGDPKQAIYRWRGGRAEQFIALSQDYNPFPNHEKLLIPLTINHRSTKEVITFNNDFFAFASKYFENETYKKLYAERSFQNYTSKEGGGVQICFAQHDISKEDRLQWYLEKTLHTIHKELSLAFSFRDIVVLTRKNDQAIQVAQFLTENNIPIISSESLLVSQADEVKIIVFILKFLNSNNIESLAEAFYLLHRFQNREEEIHDWVYSMLVQCKDNNLNDWLVNQGYDLKIQKIKRLPLYEMVDVLVRELLKIEQTHAHLQFFMDFVWEHEKGIQHGLDSFLSHWETKKESLSIATPEHIDAVRIMTVHKSKGLEFPVVIYPFVEEDFSRKIREFLWVETPDNSWKLQKVLLQESSKMVTLSDTASQQFRVHMQEAMLDRMNILYVSLTRAEQKLYIFTNLERTTKGEFRSQTLSYFFVEFLQYKQRFSNDVLTYNFGDVEAVNPKVNDSRTINHFDEHLERAKKNVVKVATNEVVMWGTSTEKAIEWGNALHELLADVYSFSDVSRAIQKRVEDGVISMNTAIKLGQMIDKLLKISKVKEYFFETIKVYNECSILMPGGQVIKPDKVVLKNDGSWGVLEYKTGKPNSKHREQIDLYAAMIQKMGHIVSSKIILYFQDSTVEVVELQ